MENQEEKKKKKKIIILALFGSAISAAAIGASAYWIANQRDNNDNFDLTRLDSKVKFTNKHIVDLDMIIEKMNNSPKDDEKRMEELKKYLDYNLEDEGVVLTDVSIHADPQNNNLVIKYRKKRNASLNNDQNNAEIGKWLVSTVDDGNDSYNNKINELIQKINYDDLSVNLNTSVDKRITKPSDLIDSHKNIKADKIDLIINSLKMSDENMKKIDIVMTNVRADDATGEIIFDVVLISKKSPTSMKKFNDLKIGGLFGSKSGQDDLDRQDIISQFNKITNVILTPTSKLKVTLPSDVSNDDLDSSNLLLKENDEDFVLPKGFEIEYKLDNIESRHDANGELPIIISITKNGTTLKQNFIIKNLKTKITDLSPADINLSIPSKGTTLASEFTDPSASDTTKIVLSATSNLTPEELANYDVTYEKVWSNDVEGKTGFAVTLTSKTDPSVTKRIEYAEVDGFKAATVTASLNDFDFTWKPDKSDTTAALLERELNAIADPDAKIAKLQEYFEITLPDNHRLKQIVSLTPKETPKTTGILTLVLEKNGVSQGTSANPDATGVIDSVELTVDITKFADVNDLIQNLLNSITSVETKSTGNLNTKFPYEIRNTDLTAANLQDKQDATDFVIPEGYTLSYVIPSKPKINNLNGTMEIALQLSRDGDTRSKTFTINNLKAISKLDLDLKLATGIIGSETLPSQLWTGTNKGNASKLKTIVKTDSSFSTTELDKFTISYLKTASDDNVGKATFTIVLNDGKTPPTIKKLTDYEIIGLKKKVDTLTATDLILNTMVDKSTILPSSLIDSSGNIDLTKISLAPSTNLPTDVLELYNVTYSKSWVNDVTGEIGLDVTLSLKTDPSVTKQYPSITLDGFKTHEVTESLTSENFTIKESKKPLTINDLANQLNTLTGDAKLAKLKEYLDIVIPTGIELVEISDFSAVPGSSTQANLTYKIAKLNIANGTESDKNATSEVRSLDKIVVLEGFIAEASLVAAELAKITSISLNSPSDLKTKLPSAVNLTDLSASNLLANTTDGSYVAPEGYGISYDFTEPKLIDDHTGEVSVKVTITKDGASNSKIIKVKGLSNKLKSLAENNLTLSLNDGTSAATTMASQLLKADGTANKTKLKSMITDWTAADLMKYDITYTKSWINDLIGNAGFDVTLTLKTDSTITRIFADKEISSLKLYAITTSLNTADFTFKSGKEDTTVDDFINAINLGSDNKIKTNKLKEYFDIANLEGNDFEFVNFVKKSDSNTIGTLTYKLSKSEISAGNKTNKTALGKFTTSDLTIDINGFTSPSNLARMELDKITSLELTSSSALRGIMPIRVAGELTTDNIQAKVAEANYLEPAGYTLSYELPKTNTHRDNINGTMHVIVKITKDGVSESKELQISGLRQIKSSDFRIDPLPGNSADTRKTMLPSEVNTKVKYEYLPWGSSPIRYRELNNSYDLIPDFRVDDHLGIFFAPLTMRDKRVPAITKKFTFEYPGFKKEIDVFNNADFNLGINGTKNLTIPSSLLLSSGAIDTTKIVLSPSTRIPKAVSDRYNITYTKAWVNDIVGNIGINIRLVSKEDGNINKTFSNIVISGLKPYTITQKYATASTTIKSTKSPVTISDLNAQLTGQTATDKIRIMKEFINFSSFAPVELGEIVSFAPKGDSKTTGVLTYKLTKNNVANGSASNKTATETVTTANLTVDINGFADLATLLMREMEKITALQLTSSSALKTKLPGATNLSDLTTANIQVLTSSGIYTPPTGFALSYAVAKTDTHKDNIAGSMKVIVKLTKEGVSTDSEKTLSGLKAIEKADLTVGPKTGVVLSDVLSSDVLSNKLDATLLSSLGITSEKFDNQYTKTFTYTTSANDIEKKVNVNLRLTDKTKSSSTKEFTLFEITGLATQLSKLEEFRIKLASNIGVTDTLPSTLVNSDNSPRNIKVILNGDVSGRFSLNDYNISYKKLWINDINGTAAFDVTLVSKTDSTVKRVFSNIQFIGLKHFEVTDSLTSPNFSFKTGFENTTVSELKSQLDSLTTPALKANKLNSYFNITTPAAISLTDVIGFTEKASDPTVGILRYQLAKSGIANGSDSDRTATGLIKSITKEVEIPNFAPLTRETKKYLDSITSLSPITGHAIKQLIPQQVTQTHLDTGVNAKVGENSLVLPSGFKITFTKLEKPQSDLNHFNGSMNVLVAITKNNDSRTTVSKILKLPDLKYYYELLSPNDVLVTRNTATANTYAFNTWKIMDDEFQEKYFETTVTIPGFRGWEEYYDVKYEYDYINEVEGIIGVNLVFINKENPLKRRIFSKEVFGFKQYVLPTTPLKVNDFGIVSGQSATPAQLRDYVHNARSQEDKIRQFKRFMSIGGLYQGTTITDISVNKGHFYYDKYFTFKYKFARLDTRIGTKTNKRATTDLISPRTIQIDIQASSSDNSSSSALYAKNGFTG